MGAVSRERHRDAMRQIESTGVDRFFTVLSPTNEGRWTPEERFLECLRYLEFEPAGAVYVSPEDDDLRRVGATGAHTLRAGWAEEGAEESSALAHPSRMWDVVCRPPRV